MRACWQPSHHSEPRAPPVVQGQEGPGRPKVHAQLLPDVGLLALQLCEPAVVAPVLVLHLLRVTGDSAGAASAHEGQQARQPGRQQACMVHSLTVCCVDVAVT